MTHLQYDDTMLAGVPPVQNLLTVKAVLRSFELASSLKVNFPRVVYMVFM